MAFLKETDAAVLFPGGFGTQDEAMETLTLIQTGKHHPMPVVLMDEPGGTYWIRWKDYIQEEVRQQGYIDLVDERLFDIETSVDQAAERIQRFYCCYHSMRYVGDCLAMRRKKELSDG